MARRHQQPPEPPKPRRSLLGHLTALLLKTIALIAVAVIAGIILTRTTTFDLSNIRWWWIPAGALVVAILWQAGGLGGDERPAQAPTQTTDIYGRTTEAFYDDAGQRRDITYRPGTAYGHNTIEREQENNSGWY